MRKIFAILVTLICIVIYYVSLEDDLTKRFTAARLKSRSLLGSDRYRHGDLYGMSYLARFRREDHENKIPYPNCNFHNEINLYAICDSYVWAFFDSTRYYCGVNSLQYARVNGYEMFESPLDTTKINVLLIELVERNIREVLSNSAYLENVLNIRKPANSPAISQPGSKAGKATLSRIKERTMATLFNKEINTNLESNLWDYSFFTPLKETKAAINYRLFNTIDKEVTLSSSGDQLFYTPTIDSSQKFTSSFNSVSDEEVSVLVGVLNRLGNKASLAGYDSVYLTLVPNPVTILEPGYRGLTHNRLLERIQAHPALQLPYLDLMPEFRRHKNDVYFRSDTHWNDYGASIWLSRFNEKLEALVALKKKS